MTGMDINTMASWVNVVAMAVWPVVVFAGRKAFQHLTNVDNQLKNNGGASIKDAVDRIEASLEELKKDTRKNRKQVKKLKGDLEAHLAEMME